MRKDAILYLVHPGARPAFYLLADYLWGANANTDSDGDSRYPTDTKWTELSLFLRDNREEQQLHIDPISTVPLILRIRSPNAELAEKAALYLSELTEGTIARTLPVPETGLR